MGRNANGGCRFVRVGAQSRTRLHLPAFPQWVGTCCKEENWSTMVKDLYAFEDLICLVS